MVLALLAPAALAQDRPAAPPGQPKIERAVDGIFAAFAEHPLVGLGEHHNLAEAGAFYVALVRDPRFATEVGNLVVETGGAAHQDVIDRYVGGQDVPYAELRQVWTDLVGWTPDQVGQMYPDLFAAVRKVNAKLPPSRRIHVWLGEPPIDWSRVNTADDLAPAMAQRDSFPAGLIVREILDKHRKALVIYGGGHFFTAPPGYPGLGYLISKDHPGAFFVAAVYGGNSNAACVAALEAGAVGWQAPVLASPIAGTWLSTALRDPACVEDVKFNVPPGAPPPTLEQAARRAVNLARAKLVRSGVLADGLLYLGPSARLTRTPYPTDVYLDAAYGREALRRQTIVGALDAATPEAARAANQRRRMPFVQASAPDRAK